MGEVNERTSNFTIGILLMTYGRTMYYNIRALFFTIVSSLVQVNIYLYTDLQSTLDISKSRLISSYQYLKVSFLVQENLLGDTNSSG